MRIVVEIKRGEEAQLILNNLFKYTQMQEFLRHDSAVHRCRTAPRARPHPAHQAVHRSSRRSRAPPHHLRAAQAREREHILVGYQIALDHLDDVIRIIRGSASRAEAKENLLKYFTEQDVTITENGKSRKLEGVKLDGRKYKLGALEGEPTARSATPGLTPIQVDAILELQLHRLEEEIRKQGEIIDTTKPLREGRTEGRGEKGRGGQRRSSREGSTRKSPCKRRPRSRAGGEEPRIDEATIATSIRCEGNREPPEGDRPRSRPKARRSPEGDEKTPRTRSPRTTRRKRPRPKKRPRPNWWKLVRKSTSRSRSCKKN